MEIACKRLRELREQKHLKQTEIAKMLGITQQIYSNYEIGKCELPLRYLVQLANLYEVSTDYILGRVSYPEIPPQYKQPLVTSVSVGDLVCRVSSFNARSKRHLIEYINFLTYRETLAKTKQKLSSDFTVLGNESEPVQ